MEIERKWDFNQITPEEIITYKFAATINDKKAGDKFIKGPLEQRIVLETIELDIYNRKYGHKKQKIKTKSRGGLPQTVPPAENKLLLPDLHRSEDRWTPTRRNCQPVIATFAGNLTGRRNISDITVQHL